LGWCQTDGIGARRVGGWSLEAKGKGHPHPHQPAPRPCAARARLFTAGTPLRGAAGPPLPVSAAALRTRSGASAALCTAARPAARAPRLAPRGGPAAAPSAPPPAQQAQQRDQGVRTAPLQGPGVQGPRRGPQRGPRTLRRGGGKSRRRRRGPCMRAPGRAARQAKTRRAGLFPAGPATPSRRPRRPQGSGRHARPARDPRPFSECAGVSGGAARALRPHGHAARGLFRARQRPAAGDQAQSALKTSAIGAAGGRAALAAAPGAPP
jgi:hypothetical protein